MVRKLIAAAFTLSVAGCSDALTAPPVPLWLHTYAEQPTYSLGDTLTAVVTNISGDTLLGHDCYQFERRVERSWRRVELPHGPVCTLPGLHPVPPGHSSRYSLPLSTHISGPGDYRVVFTGYQRRDGPIPLHERIAGPVPVRR